jgi:hypothetical protein
MKRRPLNQFAQSAAFASFLSRGCCRFSLPRKQDATLKGVALQIQNQVHLGRATS